MYSCRGKTESKAEKCGLYVQMQDGVAQKMMLSLASAKGPRASSPTLAGVLSGHVNADEVLQQDCPKIKHLPQASYYI